MLQTDCVFPGLQIAYQYIYTYGIPLYSKSLAGSSANGTQINSFYASNDHLANYNDTGGVTPNHDTLYNLAFLDLSQVALIPPCSILTCSIWTLWEPVISVPGISSILQEANACSYCQCSLARPAPWR